MKCLAPRADTLVGGGAWFFPDTRKPSGGLLLAVVSLGTMPISTPSLAQSMFSSPAAVYNPVRQEFVVFVTRDMGDLDFDGFIDYGISSYVYNSRGELQSGPNDFYDDLPDMFQVRAAVGTGINRALVVWQTSSDVEGILIDLLDYSVVSIVTFASGGSSSTEVGVAFDSIDGTFGVAWANSTLINFRAVDAAGNLSSTTTMLGVGGVKEHLSLVHVPLNDSFLALYHEPSFIAVKSSTQLASNSGTTVAASTNGNSGSIVSTIGRNFGNTDDYHAAVLYSSASSLQIAYVDEFGAIVDGFFPIGSAASQVPALAQDLRNGHPVFLNGEADSPFSMYFGEVTAAGSGETIVSTLSTNDFTSSHTGYTIAYAPDCDTYFGAAVTNTDLNIGKNGMGCESSLDIWQLPAHFVAGIDRIDVNVLAKGAPVNVSAVTLQGTGKAAYTLDASDCIKVINQNDTCTLVVRRVGNSQGQPASIVITSDAGVDPTRSIPLTHVPITTPVAVQPIGLLMPADGQSGVDPLNASLTWTKPSFSFSQFRVWICTDQAMTKCQATTATFSTK